MAEPKFWIDFDNGDLYRDDGVAVAFLCADHCDPNPETLADLDEILKTHQSLIEERDLLKGQIKNLREVLTSINRGASVTGRWIVDGDCVSAEGHDEHEEDFPPDDPNAVWEEYTHEEQNTQLETIARQAEEVLEATKEGV